MDLRDLGRDFSDSERHKELAALVKEWDRQVKYQQVVDAENLRKFYRWEWVQFEEKKKRRWYDACVCWENQQKRTRLF